MTEKIRASFIIEILGRPPEHIEEALKGLIEKLGEEKGIKIVEKNFNKAKQIDNEKDLFTAFVNIEAEFENFSSLLFVVFNYMPSHFEIISPEEFKVHNLDMNTLVTNTILRLHKYDEIAKKMTMDNAIMHNHINDLVKVISEMQNAKKAQESASDGKKPVKKKK